MTKKEAYIGENVILSNYSIYAREPLKKVHLICQFYKLPLMITIYNILTV